MAGVGRGRRGGGGDLLDMSVLRVEAEREGDLERGMK